MHVFGPGRGRFRREEFFHSHGDGGEENGNEANRCGDHGHIGESLKKLSVAPVIRLNMLDNQSHLRSPGLQGMHGSRHGDVIQIT